MTPEGRVKAAVKAVLKELGAWQFMPVQRGMGTMGIPDFITCLKGRFVAIETKAPGGEPTPLQKHQLASIGEAGGAALVIDTTDKEAIRRLLAGAV